MIQANFLFFTIAAYFSVNLFMSGKFYEEDNMGQEHWAKKIAYILVFSLFYCLFVSADVFWKSVKWIYQRTWLASYFKLIKYEKDLSILSDNPERLKQIKNLLSTNKKVPLFLNKRFDKLIEKKLELLREDRRKHNEVIDF